MKKRTIVLLSVFLLTAILIPVLLLLRPKPALIALEGAETAEKNEDSISVPGFEVIRFQADTVKQTVSLSNPAENTCYFRLSLYLGDGSLLWQSELIPPGMRTNGIKLLFSLSPGTYPDCVLHYDCFADREAQTPLNGADTVCTVIAQ